MASGGDAEMDTQVEEDPRKGINDAYQLLTGSCSKSFSVAALIVGLTLVKIVQEYEL